MSSGAILVTRFQSRWLLLALMLLLATFSRGVDALGLGEMQVTSVINEPLAATIPVLNSDGIQQSELIVALGSNSDYEATGITWDFSHSELQFDVAYAANGSLIVNVTSSRPIREPYLNVLVQARWPAGRLLMEYTVLLDFPVFSGSSNTASASSSSSASSAISSTAAAVSRPAPQPAAAAAPARTAAPVQSVPVPRVVSGAPSTQRAETLGTDEYRIQNGDTLWSLGGRVAQDLGVSRHQAMIAIRESNPEAFIQGDMNMLRSGSVVRVPPRNTAIARSESQAVAEFSEAMSGRGSFADTTPLQSRNTDFRNETASTQTGEAQFRLTAGAQSDTNATGGGVDELVEENQELADINAALQEELAAAEISNRDLNDRLANLEEQISLMEAVIELENNEIRAVQEAVSAVQPVVQPVTTATVQEQGIVSRLISWLPLVGIVLVGLLVGAYLLVRKRKSNDGFDDADFLEDSAVSEEDASETSTEDHAQEPEGMPDMDDSDLDDFMGMSADDEEATEQDEDVGTESEAIAEDLADFAADEEPAVESSTEEEDWGSDFDDLDSFFDGADDNSDTEGSDESAAEELSDESSIDIDGSDSEEDSEDDSEKTQIFDSAAMAEMAAAEREDSVGEIDLSEELEDDTEDSTSDNLDHDSDDENALDFSLDEDLSAADSDHAEAPVSNDSGDDFSMDFEVDSNNPEEAEVADSVEVAEEVVDEFAMDFEVDDETIEAPAEEDSIESEESSDDEFSMDFDLGDTETEIAEEPKNAESEDSNEELDAENTLSFDVSDMDIPVNSEDDTEAAPSAEADEDLDALFDTDSVDLADSSAEDTGDSDDDFVDVEADLDSLLDDLDDDSSDVELEADSDDLIEDIGELSEDDLELPDMDDSDDLLSDFGDSDVDDVDADISDAEEFETKLELASAYKEMGDSTGAKELLEEVIRDGDEASKVKAQGVLDSLS